jgi:hypothetical protein
LRKSATIHDPRLPGGEATGKIIGYSFSVDGWSGVNSNGLSETAIVSR